MDEVDVVVVGAGVVGLASARALARAGLQVLILEQAGGIGTGTSSRNSEVIHSGLYGTPGTLKASLCVRGRALLTQFCDTFGVAYRLCGKLVVATRTADETRLEKLLAQGLENGVEGLELIGQARVRLLEPELASTAALHSPCSGIVDSHGLMTALLGDAQAHGALLALRTTLQTAEPVKAGWRVSVGDGYELQGRWLVNAAGLDAQAVAGRMAGFPAHCIPRRHLARGHYFALARKAPFERLVYPLPVDGGLGIHLTLDMGGTARFGPDVQWLDTSDGGADMDYGVDPALRARFEGEVRRYWPGLPAESLSPAYSGIRPKLSGPGEPTADFHIAGPAAHGCNGVVQMFGIESPGLTASLAIAERVASIVLEAAA